jgi:gluconolactonase
MKLLPAFFLSVLTTFAADGPKQSIEKLDPALDALIASDAKIETISNGGYTWSEGPAWYKGRVVFSDVPNNVAYQWIEGDAVASVFLKPSGTDEASPNQGSNGLAVDGEGRLLLCQHGSRRVARLGGDGKFVPLATKNHEGVRFNSPNDLCVAKDGSVYFTDPAYGLPKGEKSETPYHGVYKLATDGKVTLVTKAVQWPNGIALSLDQKSLYLAVSDGKNPRVATCALDGSGLRDVFLAAPLKSKERAGSCDGLRLDAKGNIWTTGPGGVLILSPEGKHLGSILCGQATANLTWGDDGHTLYITSKDRLLRVKTKVKGAGF